MWRFIIPHFPPHYAYVEPFGGAANVLLNKPPSPVEVYNDIDSGIVTIFRVLRDRPEELLRALKLTPYSREEYLKSLEPLDGLDDLEKARRLFVRYRQTFSGKGQVATPGRWRYTVTSSAAQTWARVIDELLLPVAERFRNVIIENLPWQDIIERYDSPETLFYCDPPYMPTERVENKAYANEMSVEEHRQLAEVLNSVQGHVVLSGYPSPEYDKWYAGWERVEFQVKATARVVHDMERPLRREVLWIKTTSSRRQRRRFFA